MGLSRFARASPGPSVDVSGGSNTSYAGGDVRSPFLPVIGLIHFAFLIVHVFVTRAAVIYWAQHGPSISLCLLLAVEAETLVLSAYMVWANLFRVCLLGDSHRPSCTSAGL